MNAHPVVSERLAEALRTDNNDEFHDTSPYAACLLPLLRELGWNNYARDLIEALPHFSEQIDLIDLRNILVTLGYDSSPLKTDIHSLQDELYPALFISNGGKVLLLQGKRDGLIYYYDAQTNQYESTPQAALKRHRIPVHRQ